MEALSRRQWNAYKTSELKAAVDAQSTNEDVESTKMDKGRDLYKNSDVGDINEDI